MELPLPDWASLDILSDRFYISEGGSGTMTLTGLVPRVAYDIELALPYDLEKDLPRILEENGFEVLGIEIADAAGVSGLARAYIATRLTGSRSCRRSVGG